MGKDLKGKECGKDICLRKDGKYTARFINKCGKRVEKHLPTLPETRNWLETARYEDKHGSIPASSDMTTDNWFNIWINNIVCDPKRS